MKTITKIVAATVAAFSLTAVGAVFAHPGMGAGMGPGMHGGMQGGLYGAETAAARLAGLKTELKITDAQEGAWQAFAAAVQQQAAARDALRAQMRAQMQAETQGPNATPADRSAHFEAMSKSRDEHLAARSAALKDLYAVLTPEQKLIADQRLMPGRGPGMAWRTPAK